ARNDVAVNLAIIAMALVTAWTGSGWPDIVLGLVIVVGNARAAWEGWGLAGGERRAARALAGEGLDD
ncbi:MAG TPA: cation transporter, partial [Ornithinibacter sp.]|nr:cation transporter [Ornithinibacter sp.]